MFLRKEKFKILFIILTKYSKIGISPIQWFWIVFNNVKNKKKIQINVLMIKYTKFFYIIFLLWKSKKYFKDR